VADGFSCRSQIRSATDRAGPHLAEVLALAIREGREGPPSARPEQRLPDTTVPAGEGRGRLVAALLAAGVAGAFHRRRGGATRYLVRKRGASGG
jgi:hypothetical protein